MRLGPKQLKHIIFLSSALLLATSSCRTVSPVSSRSNTDSVKVNSQQIVSFAFDLDDNSPQKNPMRSFCVQSKRLVPLPKQMNRKHSYRS